MIYEKFGPYTRVKFAYRGWFGQTAKRRCPHAKLEGLYGDHIHWSGGWRLYCADCGQFLDGPVSLSQRLQINTGEPLYKITRDRYTGELSVDTLKEILRIMDANPMYQFSCPGKDCKNVLYITDPNDLEKVELHGWRRVTHQPWTCPDHLAPEWSAGIEFISRALGTVGAYLKTQGIEVPVQDIFIVWFNYTLGNWKAMVSTTLLDNMYYEVTYDKNNQSTYLDAYKKIVNLKISDFVN